MVFLGFGISVVFWVGDFRVWLDLVDCWLWILGFVVGDCLSSGCC